MFIWLSFVSLCADSTQGTLAQARVSAINNVFRYLQLDTHTCRHVYVHSRWHVRSFVRTASVRRPRGVCASVPSLRPCIRTCGLTCGRAYVREGGRAGGRVWAGGWACRRAGVRHECMCTCMRVCMHACNACLYMRRIAKRAQHQDMIGLTSLYRIQIHVCLYRVDSNICVLSMYYHPLQYISPRALCFHLAESSVSAAGSSSPQCIEDPCQFFVEIVLCHMIRSTLFKLITNTAYTVNQHVVVQYCINMPNMHESGSLQSCSQPR